MNYQSYLAYMKHINWENSKYRVLTEEEFMVLADWLRFVEYGVEPMEKELF